jgi:ribosomal protein S18 acetylase RimI-like enzyme
MHTSSAFEGLSPGTTVHMFVRAKENVASLQIARDESDEEERILALEEDSHSTEGPIVGHARLQLYKEPFPFMYVASLRTHPALKEKGVASKLMREIQNKIRECGFFGVLHNVITEMPENAKLSQRSNKYLSEMYSRRGWELLPGSEGMMFYNPNKVPLHIVKDAVRTMHDLYEYGKPSAGYKGYDIKS